MSESNKNSNHRIDPNPASASMRGTQTVAMWREQLAEFWKVSAERANPEPEEGDEVYQKLYDDAQNAIIGLGGQGEPSNFTVADYDHINYGPMLGVSDEGSATAAIRRGVLAAPKAQVLGSAPLIVGAAHDAERLGSVGEVAVGPDEFATIRLACRNRLFTTTNVGTRVNVRNFSPRPVIELRGSSPELIVSKGIKDLQKAFQPYRKTASGKARACTIYVRLRSPKSPARKRAVLAKLQLAVDAGEFTSPNIHRLGLVGQLPKGSTRLVEAKKVIDLAAAARIRFVALEASPLPNIVTNDAEAGLLNILAAADLSELLRFARSKNVVVDALHRVDPQTTARHVWTGLTVARNMGLELGKYGLVPLTFEEQHQVIARIQYWLGQWAAAPVYYVDYPLVDKFDVYFGKSLAKGIKRWLKFVGKLHVPVVLIDTARKSEKRRLLKDTADDPVGFLKISEIKRLSTFGLANGVKVLWAGGITLPQALQFGMAGVFGVYVTSAAAVTQAVTPKERRDPSLLSAREPEEVAVARVKLLLEAGFLIGESGRQAAAKYRQDIKSAAKSLLSSLAEDDTERLSQAHQELHRLVSYGWRRQLGEAAPTESRV